MPSSGTCHPLEECAAPPAVHQAEVMRRAVMLNHPKGQEPSGWGIGCDSAG